MMLMVVAWPHERPGRRTTCQRRPEERDAQSSAWLVSVEDLPLALAAHLQANEEALDSEPLALLSALFFSPSTAAAPPQTLSIGSLTPCASSWRIASFTAKSVLRLCACSASAPIHDGAIHDGAVTRSRCRYAAGLASCSSSSSSFRADPQEPGDKRLSLNCGACCVRPS